VVQSASGAGAAAWVRQSSGGEAVRTAARDRELDGAGLDEQRKAAGAVLTVARDHATAGVGPQEQRRDTSAEPQEHAWRRQGRVHGGHFFFVFGL